MSDGHPSDATLDQLAAGLLSAPEAEAVNAHIARCADCSRAEAERRSLIQAIAAPAGARPAEADVAAVMRRIRSAPATARPPSFELGRWLRWLMPTMVAAAALVLAVVVLPRHPRGGDGFVSRGGDGPKTLAQQVGVHFAAVEPTAVSLRAGMSVSLRAGLLVSYRNLEEKRPVYLLAFAVDARRELHWLYPAYEEAGTNPASVQLATHRDETVMPQAVMLENAATGPARLISVVSSTPLHVLDVESLPVDSRTATAIQRRWRDAAVSEVPVVLTP